MSISEDRPIVVGIDGSTNSLAALRWALREGAAVGAPVEVLHCWTAQTLPDLVLAPAHELKIASICMLHNEVEAAVAEMPDPPTVTEISLSGDPAGRLVGRSAHARLLVLGVRQTTVMRDLAHGAIGTVCRKQARSPVVTVDRAGSVSWHHPLHPELVSG
ncbi:nucleotide-binding universal stress UspA family protein [Nakamurella sp. UYEF19]|uniref:universal stress protein n=1 Tax=Nakamurella sp. UYEF19 TaxID=1756392 RepID=UPI003394BD38